MMPARRAHAVGSRSLARRGNLCVRGDEVTYTTRKVKEEDVLRALEKGLEGAPLRFSLTDGQVAHLTSSAKRARMRRVRRQLLHKVA